MRSKAWIRSVWNCPPLLLFCLIGAVMLCNAEVVASQDTIPEGSVDSVEDPIPEGSVNVTADAIPEGGVNATTDPIPEGIGNGTADPIPEGSETPVADLSPTGKCSEEIKKFCTLKSELAVDCISKKLQTEDGKDEVSEGCKQEYRDLKVSLSRDLTKIQNACKKDIVEKCTGFHTGGFLACLRDVKDGLSQSCQDEIFVAEKDAVDDYRMDPLLAQMCSEDVVTYCKGVQPGEGRIQACLRNHSEDVSYNCEKELFRQEAENADDLRLNPELFQACLTDQKNFCPNLRPGKARVKDCLESNRLEPGFSASCKSEFDKMLARRSADFRLNPTLKAKCELDIKLSCEAQSEDLRTVPDGEPKIIHCLQDFKENLKSEDCKTEVHKLLALAAEDYRFDKEFSDSCEASKQKYCKNIENDKVLSCLQTQREQLDNKCRAAVFNMEWRLSGDIDYKFAMKEACVVETGKFCHGLHHGRGAIIECLQEKVEDTEMGADCKKEILVDQVESAKDFRLNYRIYKDCREDVNTLCSVAQTCKGPEPCGGVVLQCLQGKADKLSSEECKKDVISFEIKESKNEDLNIPLQKACKDDLLKFCPRRSTDHSKALACLRRHRSELKKVCKKEELHFSMMEASDIRLTPSLMNACGTELIHFCPNVSPTNGEAFKCLQLHLESIYMGVPCKVEVDLQGARQASDYRLDVRVRTECKDDVSKLCSGVNKDEDGHALVLKCFVAQYRNLTGGCQTEVAYAVRMALFQYKFDSDLTSPCDANVKKTCNSSLVKPIDGVVIGTFGQCLITQRRRILDPDCRSLIRVATRDGAFLNGTTTDADVAAALLKYKELVAANALGHSGVGLFWITTVVAFVAVLAVALFRRYSGPPKTYTLVVKGGDL